MEWSIRVKRVLSKVKKMKIMISRGSIEGLQRKASFLVLFALRVGSNASSVSLSCVGCIRNVIVLEVK